MVLDYERNENIMEVSINSIIGFSIKSNEDALRKGDDI